MKQPYPELPMVAEPRQRQKGYHRILHDLSSQFTDPLPALKLLFPASHHDPLSSMVCMDNGAAQNWQKPSSRAHGYVFTANIPPPLQTHGRPIVLGPQWANL